MGEVEGVDMENTDERDERLAKLEKMMKEYKANPGILAEWLQPSKEAKRTSLITYCHDCGVSGVTLPHVQECGNCGSSRTHKGVPL